MNSLYYSPVVVRVSDSFFSYGLMKKQNSDEMPTNVASLRCFQWVKELITGTIDDTNPVYIFSVLTVFAPP